ncbi:hypothetical protein W5O_00579 [Candida albicans Ca6]|nr:hypothetical protein MGM_00569 [Candida albicans P75063]KHC49094.1 hypothetical protein W5O_00579 [Candida albicans Ca6]
MSEEEEDKHLKSPGGSSLNPRKSSDLQPSASSSSQTLDDTHSQPKSTTPSESTEYTSPSKSLKSFFFKNRLSSYSIDSISEQPELEFQSHRHSTERTRTKKSSSIGSAELSPSRSPRMMNFSLRPKFIRSRSSGISDTSTGSTHPIPPAASVLSSSSQRRATIEDFADTESEESNDSNEDIEDKNQDQTNANKQQREHHHHHQQQQSHDIDEDSINSLLQEYHNRDSEFDNKDIKNKFIFREEFDDTNSIKTKSRPASRILTPEENEELKAEIIRQGSIRSSGGTSSSSQILKPLGSGMSRGSSSQQQQQQPYIDTQIAQQYYGDARKHIEVVDPTKREKSNSVIATTVSGDSPTALKRLSGGSNSSGSSSANTAIGGGGGGGGSENRNSGASSATSLRFKIYNDKIEPIKHASAGKHMSTSTTNAEAAGISGADRSSMRVSTAFSDESETAGDAKYPEPTVTPIQTPRINRNSDTPSTDTNYTSNDTSGISYEAPLAIAGSLHKSSSTSSSSPNSGHRSSSSVPSTPLRTQHANQQHGSSNLQRSGGENLQETKTDADGTRSTGGTNTTSTGFFDETMLKGGSRKSVAHSSMSSGELLQNLEHSYDYSKSNDNSGNSDDTNQNQTKATTAQQIKQSTPIHEFVIKDAKKSPPMSSPPQIDTYLADKPPQSGEDEVFGTSIPRPMGIPKSDSVGQNMTAGLDSKSELPVMLFKVQDRDIQRDSKFFDNSNSHGQRKSGGGDGGIGGEDENQSLSGCDSESAGNIRESVSGSVSGSGSGSGNGSGTRSGRSSRGRLTIGSLSEAGNSSRSSGSSIKQIISRHFRSIGESLNTDEKQPQPESNSQEPSQQQPLRSLNLVKDSPPILFDEKNHIIMPSSKFDQESQQEPTKQTIDYPWINWSLLMLLGLIVPPLYFVIPIGLMDRDYLGLRYANKPSKKFTTTQKIISLILGILWLLIVLAMIGVGIGLGVTRES